MCTGSAKWTLWIETIIRGYKLEWNTGDVDMETWREGNGDRTAQSVYTCMEFSNQYK